MKRGSGAEEEGEADGERPETGFCPCPQEDRSRRTQAHPAVRFRMRR